MYPCIGDLNKFLMEIVGETWANDDVQKVIVGPGHYQIPAKRGEWSYLDEYRGFDPFWGKEIVRFDDRIVFTRAYMGGMRGGDTLYEKEFIQSTFRFLQKAMMDSHGIARGPKVLVEGVWKYTHSEFDETGWAVENIFFKEEVVHEVIINVTTML